MFSFWSLDLRLSDILFFLLPLSSTVLLIPFLMLFKVLLQGLQGPSTVGNRVFDSRVQLSIGLIKAFGLKDWIPAKVLPATCWNNCALQKYKLYCYCMPASDLRPEVVSSDKLTGVLPLNRRTSLPFPSQNPNVQSAYPLLSS